MSMSDEKNFQEPTKVIGYWMSEKKSQKLNWTDFSSVCRQYGYKLVKLNLDIPLEEQGPFTIIVHKLTEIIVRSDEKAIKMIRNVEEYIESHREVAVLDPLDNVKKLLDRYSSYRAIRDSHLNKYGVFTPAFVELTSDDICTNLQRLKKAGVTFPLISKPSVSHGTKECHKMAVIFNEAGLKDCKPPCVAQSFVNHDALLFKVYILGENYCVAERPSLKNFYPCDHETIFFDSHEVSKPDSTSSLSILDPHEEDQRQHVLLDPNKLKTIVHKLRNIIGMSLLGIDIVIENSTGRYAIIDINAYPGYDGYPNFFEHLMLCIQETEENHKEQFLLKNKTKLNSPSLKRMNVINHSPDIEYNNYNEIVMENGQHKRIDNSIVESDNEDDILNSNKNNNTNCNNRNLIVNNEQSGDPLLNARSESLHNDDDKKCKQLQQQQRVRTVSSKKSVERQL